jgi:GT2 family glycosyltransferase
VIVLSIIVVGHNQHRQLHSTLAGLAVQFEEHPDVPAEVVVVDNGSAPRLEAHVLGNAGVSVRVIRRELEPPFFRPGSARNVGARAATGDALLFLDGDCVPSTQFLREHARHLPPRGQRVLTIGHREFVDEADVTPEAVHERRGAFDALRRVRSSSNYGLPADRRLGELRDLANHPLPFNCCHGCNLGVRRADFDAVGGFDLDFDGFWGYEDIELGYRLWRSGVEIVYVPDAFVFHQEGGGLSAERRRLDRRRNFDLACAKIPGFADFRRAQGRSYYGDPSVAPA